MLDIPTRAQRRAVPGGRDEVRANPMPAKEPMDGEVGFFVRTPRPMPAPVRSTRSGQLRIDAKRSRRAAEWKRLLQTGAVR